MRSPVPAPRIPLPNGDVLVPDADFRKEAGGISYRTGLNWDQQGCPHVHIGGYKYRPHDEGMAWIASRIKRRNTARRQKDLGQPRIPAA